MSKKVEIYSDIIEIRAKKGKDSIYAERLFKHTFKPGSKVIGNEDGSITIQPPKGRRLWKRFPQ